jgi:hypothetical protein
VITVADYGALSTRSVTREFGGNATLINPAPRTLVTRGTYILDSLGTADVIIRTYGTVWEAAPDHMLQLEITNLDSPYIAPSRVPSVTNVSDVRLALPVR